jgi:hypothetical protein
MNENSGSVFFGERKLKTLHFIWKKKVEVFQFFKIQNVLQKLFSVRKTE